MDQLVSPEHVQLLSDLSLRTAIDACRERDRLTDREAALARTLRYELRRRQCEVPVADRYDCVLFTAS